MTRTMPAARRQPGEPRRPRPARVLASGLALAICALAAACGTAQTSKPASTPAPAAGSAPAASAPAASPTPAPAPATSAGSMTVATIGASGVYAPLWVGVDEGLFQKYGADVKTTVLSASAAIQALRAGDVDMVVDSEGAVQADPGGKALTYVGALNNTFYFSVYAQPSIHSVKDLQGKVVTASSPNATTAYAMKNVLERAGIDPSTEVRWDYTGAPPVMLAAMQKGIVAAGVLSAPTTLLAQKDGFHDLVDLSTLNIPAAAVTLVTRRPWALQHQTLLEDFFKGLIKGIAATRSDRAEFRKVVAAATKVSTTSVLDATYTYYRNSWPTVPYITTAAVAEAIRDVPSPAAKQHKPADYIDNAPLNALVSSGFVAAPSGSSSGASSGGSSGG